MFLSLHMQLNSGFTTPPSVGRCMPGAPFSDEFERHERVFVVGEHDDTFVYHLHLGSDSKVFKFIGFYVLSCINIEHEYLSVKSASYNPMHSHSFWIHQTTDKKCWCWCWYCCWWWYNSSILTLTLTRIKWCDFSEIMPRIIYHLDFLLANPDIKIMVSSVSSISRYKTLLASLNEWALHCMTCIP